MHPMMFVYWCAFAVILTLKIIGYIGLSWWWIAAMATFPFVVWIFVVILFIIAGWYVATSDRPF